MRKAAPSSSSFFRVLLLAALLSSGFGSPVRAEEKPRPELSDEVSAKLQGLQPLEDASNWDGALALVDPLLIKAGPSSYDRAVLSQLKASYLAQKNDHFGAIPLLETALELSETYGYFDSKTIQVLRYNLFNLYYERGAANKNLAAQLADYKKARAYIESWFQSNKTDPATTPPSADTLSSAEISYSSLLFSLAELEKPTNLTLIKKALDEVEVGLRSTPRPNENFYLIQLSAFQQLGRYAEAADVLEQLLKTKPDNKSYWQELTVFYINLADIATAKKDDPKAFEYNVLAILTIERAHQHGAMNTPEANLNLVSTYFTVGQYQQAAELLEAGLHDGTIKSTDKTWILLSFFYQELHKDLKAVATLHEAARLFPKSGQFEFRAAVILYGLNDTAGALTTLQNCVAKDGGEKPGQAWLFLSRLAYELQKFELAGQAVEKAAKYPQSPDDMKSIAALREAVKAALAQHAAVQTNSK